MPPVGTGKSPLTTCFCFLILLAVLIQAAPLQAADTTPYFYDAEQQRQERLNRKPWEAGFSFRVNLFDPQHGEDKERLWSQTKLMAISAVGVAGVLALMPESVTGWDDNAKPRQLPQRWWDNVRAGPVWDEDDWAINYIGHPYFGGVYYQVARKSGYSQWDSFVYSTLMSTFLWEYGVEAFAEIPSIQDLIVTPLGGWLYGEWAFQREKAILAQGGTVMGSRSLGAVSLFFLDPVERIGNGVNTLFGRELVKTTSVAFSSGRRSSDPGLFTDQGQYWAVHIRMAF